MKARKLAWNLLAVAPFALVIGLGVPHRQAPPVSHQFPGYTASETRSLEAYSGLYQQTQAYFQHPTNSVTLHALAQDWINAAAQKKIGALPPAFFAEIMENGPRNDVISCWSKLNGQVNMERLILARDHHLDLAAQDAILQFRLASILKFSDNTTLAEAGTIQMDSIHFFAGAWGKLSPAVKAECAKVFKSERSSGLKYSQLVDTLSHQFAERQAELDQIENADSSDSDQVLEADIYDDPDTFHMSLEACARHQTRLQGGIWTLEHDGPGLEKLAKLS